MENREGLNSLAMNTTRPAAPKRTTVALFWSDMAIHYYISARAASFWNHHPNAEVQAHHAIEMQLKWALVRPLPPAWKAPRADLARRTRRRAVPELWNVRHSLTQLWDMLDSDYPNHTLGAFHDYVLFLDRIEPMRYQRFPDGGGVGYMPTMEDAQRVVGGESHSIDLHKLDDLFRGLLELVETDPNLLKGMVDPGWIQRGINLPVGGSQDYYLRDNAHALWPK